MKNYTLFDKNDNLVATIHRKSPTTVLKQIKGFWEFYKIDDNIQKRCFKITEDTEYTVDGGIVLNISEGFRLFESEAT